MAVLSLNGAKPPTFESPVLIPREFIPSSLSLSARWLYVVLRSLSLPDNPYVPIALAIDASGLGPTTVRKALHDLVNDGWAVHNFGSHSKTICVLYKKGELK